MDEDECLQSAVQTVVPGIEIKDKNGKTIEAVPGHVNLGRKKLRASGEAAKMRYDDKHPCYEPQNPEKTRRVLINKSGRFGKKGWRTETHLMNVHKAFCRCGAESDEVIFRQKENGVTTDTVIWSRSGIDVGHIATITD